jgi:hypothetical protein
LSERFRKDGCLFLHGFARSDGPSHLPVQRGPPRRAEIGKLISSPSVRLKRKSSNVKLLSPAEFERAIRRGRRRSRVIAWLAVWMLVGLLTTATRAFHLSAFEMSVSTLLMLFGGGIVPIGAALWWYLNAGRKGLFTPVLEPWACEVTPEGLLLRCRAGETLVRADAVASAEWVIWDEWDQVKGIEDVVWLTLKDGVRLPLPDHAKGADRGRKWIETVVTLSSRMVQL